jgi:hypothetical protein
MADFIDADLRNSRLERVDLGGAQLRTVDLTGAQFREVELSGAVMRGVVRDRCVDQAGHPGRPVAVGPLDLPWDGVPDTPGPPRDRTARPSLDVVLELRRDRRVGAPALRRADPLALEAVGPD